jgi:hypothetical protein
MFQNYDTPTFAEIGDLRRADEKFDFDLSSLCSACSLALSLSLSLSLSWRAHADWDGRVHENDKNTTPPMRMTKSYLSSSKSMML